MEYVVSCVVLLVITYLFFDRVLRSLKVGNYGNKYVFVTGCDSGFGQRLAIRLDGLGFHVFAGCLTDEGRKYLSSNCSKRLVTVPLDVTKGESIQAALQLVKGTLPENSGLWGLVNNAGIAGLACFSEICIPEDYHQVFAVNLFGAIEMSRAFLPLLRKAGGRLVATASVCGRLAAAAAPYTVSKFGLEAYMDLLRRELYNKGVRVILVEPGAFKTTIYDVEQTVARVRSAYNRASEEVQDTYRAAMANHERNLNRLVASSNPNLDLVVDDYIHGLTSRYPRTRYSPGTDAKLFYIPVSYLPTRFTDWLLQTP
ncbi:17-beta-hydroxysteroid dehydrogenase type 6-like isoform X1 [Physella acuta]|uniref:17-beta-hydroxysteroid dehydrogenase type 6-like isoform X1 n=1 Tax=Physella acuta TaxID=109671 RepID=UPI0027DD009F|nr:17-beta-hydroxysteroid dehydrogenase type 6-like isoform X1 [Physella acuta]XP_059139707.1 17-beta-hydroxysteroid dehydrogenase type 6-like isoform X1 [Physella acuta]